MAVVTVAQRAEQLERLAGKYLPLLRAADDRRAKVLLMALVVEAKLREGE